VRKKKKFLNLNKKFALYSSLSLLSIVFVAGGISYFNRDIYEPVPHRNSVDTKVSISGMREVSSRVKETNPELKSFTWAPKKEDTLIGSQLAAVARAIKSLAPEKQEPLEKGSWVWTPNQYLTKNYVDQIISGAKSNGINVIYLAIDSYIDIFEMPKGEAREAAKKRFNDNTEYFIKKAKESGIQVDAMAGWQNWSEPGNEYKGLVVMNYAKSFNTKSEHKFRGFQYDVEPYLLPKYKENPTEVLKNFVYFIDNSENFLKDSDLRFSIVIPDYYDQGDGMTPKFKYAGSNNFAFKHLLNILDRREGSSLILMSYRNFAEGPDGSIEVSRNEINTAMRGRHNTKIIVAQETGDFPPPYITFHNTSKKYFDEEVGKIQSSLGKHKNFGGISIHYINSFLSLR
jgi:hypothetical protein